MHCAGVALQLEVHAALLAESFATSRAAGLAPLNPPALRLTCGVRITISVMTEVVTVRVSRGLKRKVKELKINVG